MKENFLHSTHSHFTFYFYRKQRQKRKQKKYNHQTATTIYNKRNVRLKIYCFMHFNCDYSQRNARSGKNSDLLF